MSKRKYIGGRLVSGMRAKKSLPLPPDDDTTIIVNLATLHARLLKTAPQRNLLQLERRGKWV
jgi:hypothetical protein